MEIAQELCISFVSNAIRPSGPRSPGQDCVIKFGPNSPFSSLPAPPARTPRSRRKSPSGSRPASRGFSLLIAALSSPSSARPSPRKIRHSRPLPCFAPARMFHITDFISLISAPSFVQKSRTSRLDIDQILVTRSTFTPSRFSR